MPIIWTSTLFEPYRENDLDISFEFDLPIENYCISRRTKIFSTFLWFDVTLVQRFNEYNREVTIHRPNASTLLSSAFISGDLIAATRGPFICYLISCPFFLRGVNRRLVVRHHHHDLNECGWSRYARLPNKGTGGNADWW